MLLLLTALMKSSLVQKQAASVALEQPTSAADLAAQAVKQAGAAAVGSSAGFALAARPEQRVRATRAIKVERKCMVRRTAGRRGEGW